VGTCSTGSPASTRPRRHGLEHVFAPARGTLVERAATLERVLDGSDVRSASTRATSRSAAPIARARERTRSTASAHVPSQGRRATRWRKPARRELGLVEAVQHGLFRPLGDGDVPVADVVAALARRGYYGWLVLEQDTALAIVPPTGAGPLDDVRRSIEFLRSDRRVGRAAARAAQTPGVRRKEGTHE
jgi:inosose dehydratase